jgi:hypothetical protein
LNHKKVELTSRINSPVLISRKEDARGTPAAILTIPSRILIALRQSKQIETHVSLPLTENVTAAAPLEGNSYLFVFSNLPLRAKIYLINILLVAEERKEAVERTVVAGKVAKCLRLDMRSASTDMVQDPEAKERRTCASHTFQSHPISLRTDTL